MNGFDYFKLALSKYADFTGRSRRSEYWYFVLFQLLVFVAVIFLSIALAISESPGLISLSGILVVIVSMVFFIPSLSVAVRRLHDTGRSGWYYLVSFIPLIGFILLIVWFCEDSEPGTNNWGPNPKNPASEDISEHLVDDLV